jgi:hypothetical protein
MFVAMWYLFAAVSFLAQQIALAVAYKNGGHVRQKEFWASFAIGQIGLFVLIAFFDFWLQPKVIATYNLAFGAGCGFPDLSQLFFRTLPKGTLFCASLVLGIASAWSLVYFRNQHEKKLLHWVPFIAVSVFGLLFLVFMPIVLVLPLLSV